MYFPTNKNGKMKLSDEFLKKNNKIAPSTRVPT